MEKKMNNRMKPVVKTFKVVIEDVDNKGMVQDYDACVSFLTDLDSIGVFRKLAVYLNAPRYLYTDDFDTRGTFNIARIKKFNPDTCEMEVVFFGKSIGLANKVNEHTDVVVPTFRMNKNTNSPAAVMRFDLIVGAVK